MLVDAEMGMHLDLNVFDRVWEGDDAGKEYLATIIHHSALNPSVDISQVHDPEDALLLAPITSTGEAAGDVKPTTEVSWMRNSNLFTRKSGTKKKEPVQIPT